MHASTDGTSLNHCLPVVYCLPSRRAESRANPARSDSCELAGRGCSPELMERPMAISHEQMADLQASSRHPCLSQRTALHAIARSTGRGRRTLVARGTCEAVNGESWQRRRRRLSPHVSSLGRGRWRRLSWRRLSWRRLSWRRLRRQRTAPTPALCPNWWVQAAAWAGRWLWGREHAPRVAGAISAGLERWPISERRHGCDLKAGSWEELYTSSSVCRLMDPVSNAISLWLSAPQ